MIKSDFQTRQMLKLLKTFEIQKCFLNIYILLKFD